MAGRRPKPDHLKLVQGNPGRRPLNRRPPKTGRGIPPCPKHLGERARKAWSSIGPTLDKMGVLTIQDAVAMEALCDAYAEWWEARETVENEGATYRTDTEMGYIIRAHPAVGIAADARRFVRMMLIEFGLTPAARSKVKGESEEQKDPFEEFVKRGASRA
jgi:P27 family predicted phage terminase small subunit